MNKQSYQQAIHTGTAGPDHAGFTSFLSSIVPVGESVLKVGGKAFNHSQQAEKMVIDKESYERIESKMSAHGTSVFTDGKALFALEKWEFPQGSHKRSSYYLLLLPQRAYSIFVTKA